MKQNTFLIWGFILTVILLSCFLVLFRFPLVYDDDGTYIFSSFNFYVPPDRTIFYSLFIFLTRWLNSIYTTIFVQNIITALVLVVAIEEAIQRNIYRWIALIGILLFSPIPFITNTLMPDIASFWIGCGILFFVSGSFLERTGSRAKTWIMALILVGGIAMHLSNGSIVLITIAFMSFILARRYDIRRAVRVVCVLIVLTFGAIFLTATINWTLGYGFRIQGSHVHIFSILVYEGLVAKACENDELKVRFQNQDAFKQICSDAKLYSKRTRKEWFGPSWFIWEQESPFYQSLGGDWENSKGILNRFNKIVLSKYLFDFVWEGLRSSWEIIIDIVPVVGSRIYQPHDWVYKAIKEKYPRKFDSFLQGVQQTGEMSRFVKIPELIWQVCHICSLMFVVIGIVILLYRKILVPTPLIGCLALFISSCLFCGITVGPYVRFSQRISPILFIGAIQAFNQVRCRAIQEDRTN